MSMPIEAAKRDLAQALRSNDSHRVKAILKSPEADLDWLDKPLEWGGSCALHIGVYGNERDGVHALLEFGCDPGVTNQNGETPLHVAADQRFENMIDLLLNAKGVWLDAARRLDKRTALHIAAAHACVDGVKRLLETGANIDAKDRDGNTPVFLAVQHNRHCAVQELVVQGANLKLRNKAMQTCMAFAKNQSQNKPMIRLLVECKPQPRQRQPPPPTPAMRQQQEPQPQVGGARGRIFRVSQPPRQQWRHAAAAAAIPEEPVLSRRSKELKSAGVQVSPRHDANSDTSDDESSSAYPMDSKIRGLCIIVNNQDYFSSDDFKERAGTDIDAHRLERLFKSLRFYVKIFKNMDANEIYWNLSNYAKRDHSSFDCYVCCILAHGKLGSIYGVDGEVQMLSELTVMLSSTNCPSLAGKPKLFFIQACRGHYLQRGAHFERHRTQDMIQMANHETDALALDEHEQQEYVLPDHGDFLISYATVAQHVSQRNREQGSVYVQTLCNVIERGRRTEDLLSLLTKVKYRVSNKVFHNEDGSVFVQMPEVKDTLRKKVYFK